MEDHATPNHDAPTAEQGQAPARRRLGRGLNALLGGGEDEARPKPAAAPAADLDPSAIAVELIERNPFQPRKDFDKEALAELAESIKAHGVLQSLLVRPHGGKYQLIAGERRLMAAKQAGLDHVPCRVLELDDKQVYEAAVEENLKRKDLNVLEKARAFKDYLDRFGGSIEDLAGRLSMSRSTLSNFLRLLELPEPVKKALGADKITNGHARALLTLREEDQVALCKRIQSEELSVRRTEELVRELQQTPADAEHPATIPFDQGKAGKTNPHMTPHVESLQDQLRGLLQARVEIKLKAKDKGRVVIEFDSNDQFEHIVRCLRRADAA